jgi:hypothetical protein
MILKVDGQCHCGAIAYQAEVDPGAMAICHCEDCQTLTAPDPSREDIADRLETIGSGFGRLTVVRDAPRMSLTPPSWELPSVPLGSHPPAWSH